MLCMYCTLYTSCMCTPPGEKLDKFQIQNGLADALDPHQYDLELWKTALEPSINSSWISHVGKLNTVKLQVWLDYVGLFVA